MLAKNFSSFCLSLIYKRHTHTHTRKGVYNLCSVTIMCNENRLRLAKKNTEFNLKKGHWTTHTNWEEWTNLSNGFDQIFPAGNKIQHS